jgi:hypothetical protein
MARSPADEPQEILLGHLGIAVAGILGCTFDEILLDRMDHAASDHCCPYQRTIEAANRIVLLCRRLTEEIQRYERYDRMCGEAEKDQEAEKGDPLPF